MKPVYKSLAVSADAGSGVAFLELNRPSRGNAMDPAFFDELPSAVQALDADPTVRVIVLSGAGRHFCSGIDLQVLSTILEDSTNGSAGVQQASAAHYKSCEGRRRETMRRGIKHMQAAISSLETCRKPVLAAVHGACIGGGVDLITACDFRFCSETAFFSVKEVDLGIVADLGTLQRLPRLVGEGNARELALTARKLGAAEARQMGLVQRVYPTDALLREGVGQVAESIAQKSPLAVVGTKRIMNFSREHSVDDSLEYTATWNSAMLLSSDIFEALRASARKVDPQFARL